MQGVFKTLEPFALDLWREGIDAFLPASADIAGLAKTTSFGGLYRKVVISR